MKFCAFILFLIHYLDDFFLTSPAGTTVCRDNLEKAKSICSELGVPSAPEKTFGPSTTLPYLGTELDSLEIEARLPLDKLLKAKDLVLKWLSKRSAKKRKLLSVIGYLQHRYKVIVPARPFLRRLIDISTMGQGLDLLHSPNLGSEKWLRLVALPFVQLEREILFLNGKLAVARWFWNAIGCG